MNIGQIPVPDMLNWIGVALLALIASLLLILTRMVKQLLKLLVELKTIKSVTDGQTPVVTGTIPEEDLAVIMAVLAELKPGIDSAAVYIK